jgi:NADH dehydrogenase (ubiquinone) 1 alpha/beta subcomplex 1
MKKLTVFTLNRTASKLNSSAHAFPQSKLVFHAAAAPVAKPVSIRAFASHAKGGDAFLDVDEVTKRVLRVLQTFEKVDPAKVRYLSI